MGIDPYICGFGRYGEQSVLLHDIVQHVSGRFWKGRGRDAVWWLTSEWFRGAVIGRIVPLWISDRKLGPLNTIILMNCFTLLAVLVVWLPFGASSVSVLYVVVTLLGVGTGSFVPLGGMFTEQL